MQSFSNPFQFQFLNSAHETFVLLTQRQCTTTDSLTKKGENTLKIDTSTYTQH